MGVNCHHDPDFGLWQVAIRALGLPVSRVQEKVSSKVFGSIQWYLYLSVGGNKIL